MHIYPAPRVLIWGLVDFHQFGKLSEPLHLFQELLISAMAAFELYLTGMHSCGWALAILSLVYYAMMYLNGERLLRQ